MVVVGQLVLFWIFCLSIPYPQDTKALEWGMGGAGPGAWALYIPTPLVLGSFNIIY